MPSGNWRWQLCLLRAYYDAYTRRRLIYESRLEDEANALPRLSRFLSTGCTSPANGIE
jgi:hypothetical protein